MTEQAKQKYFTHRQLFLVAAKGPEIAAHICAENNPAIIPAVLGNEAGAAVERYRNNQATQTDFTAICAAFFAKTYPVNKPEERKPEIMSWIMARYLSDTHNNQQIKLEDIYKIGDQIQYFTGLKNSGALAPSDHLQNYPSLAALQQRLDPFELRRTQKAANRLERRLSADTRTAIMEETTILYQGSAGKILMPHTALAAQYWGNATKWCISGKQNGDDHFNMYNQRVPITIFLPANGEKMALVEKKYWDVQDKSLHTPSPEIALLLEEARRTLDDAHILAFIEQSLPLPEQQQQENEAPRTLRKTVLQHPDMFTPPLNSAELTTIEQIITPFFTADTLPAISHELSENKRIMLGCIQVIGHAMQYAAPSLKNDRDFVLEAVRLDGLALRYVAEPFKADFDIVLEAVKNHGAALKDADLALQRHPGIVLPAINQHPLAFLYADPVLQNNPGILFEVIRKEPWILKYAQNCTLKDDHAFIDYILEQDDPESILRIDTLGLNTENANKSKILEHQINALKTLLDAGKNEVTRAHLRFIRPLWGQGKRIIGDPFEQTRYLESLQLENRTLAPTVTATIAKETPPPTSSDIEPQQP